MSPDRWQAVERLFEAALERPADERRAFLDAHAPGDPDLRREVEALLAAANEADDYFDGLAHRAGVPAFAPDADPAPLPEQRFRAAGFYLPVRELGRGGMGVVYLARRTDADEQVEQHVALKLIKRGLDSDLVQQRFLRERRILARLQHPHIARLYDGGVTPEGQPYFAMEYVEGQPLTAYCDAKRLSIEDRLRLFLDVGQAVHYAHRNLVVHRDLKPSNILVTEEGTVKLLDFGIAKLLGGDEEDTDPVTLTRTGMRVMTPAYAAPEQVRGEPVTTATDVYTLGVILYELLTGRRPHPGTTPEQVAQHVVDATPERPSTAVRRTETTTTGDGTPETLTPEDVSRARSTQTERLRRRLAGDLDTICLKALRKEPERRYASAEAFVEDVKRHLAGLPVEARRDTVGYRLGKFIRRHRVGIGAAVLVAAAVMGGLSAALWQARAAAREAEKAAEVTAFLVDMFESTDPDEANDPSITARDLLERGAQRIDENLGAQPETRASLMHVIGTLYQKLALYDDADTLLQHSLDLRRALHGDTHPDVAESLYQLATLRFDAGDYVAAESLHREALARRRTLLGPNDRRVGMSLSGLGTALWGQRKYTDAEPVYREALSILQRTGPPEERETLTAMNNLAVTLFEQGRLDEAEALHREILEIRRRYLGKNHPQIAYTLSNLGNTLVRQGKLEEADTLLQEALAIRRAVLEPDHPLIAVLLGTLGSLHMRQGDLDEAERLVRESLAIRRRRFAPDHSYVLQSLNNLAIVKARQGDLAEAERLHREVIALRTARYGPDAPSLVISLNSLAGVLIDQDKLDEAETVLEQALAFPVQTPDDRRRRGSILTKQGQIHARRGQHEDAIAAFGEALAIARELFGDAHERTAESQWQLGEQWLLTARYDEAEPLLLQSYATLQSLPDADPALLPAVRQGLFTLYTAQGKPDEAAAYAP